MIWIDYISCGRVHRLPGADTLDVFLTSRSDDALLISTMHQRRRMDAWDELACDLTVRNADGGAVEVSDRSPASVGSPVIDVPGWWEIPHPPMTGILYMEIIPESWIDPATGKPIQPHPPPVTYVLPNSPAWRAYLRHCAATYMSSPERLVDDLARAQHSKDVAAAWNLIRKGVALSSPDKTGRTDLIWAITLPDKRLSLDLIRRGRDVNTPDMILRRTPLINAADAGDVDIVRALLQRGARVNATDIYGDTALSVAVKARNAAVVAALRAVGAR